MKTKALIFGAVFACAAVPAAAVTVSGATNIRITSAIPTWIQVAELQAFDFAATNVALAANGGIATASSVFAPGFSTPAKAIDGNTGGNYSTDTIFHSGGTGGGEFLDIAFAAANLSSVTIYSRTDCCNERDFFNIEIFNAAGSLLYAGQLDARGDAVETITFGNAIPEIGRAHV